MVAGYAAALGALQWGWLLGLTVAGTVLGAQARFAVGRHLSPWLYRRLPRAAPWVALASAGVERYNWSVLGLYRFVKGAFSIVGLGAGASLLPWRRHLFVDSLGALVWASAMVSIGHGLGVLGAAFDPRWSAYVGLGLLATSILFVALAGRHIKKRLLPLAEKIQTSRQNKQ